MQRTAKIATGISVVVIAGLVALAAPLVATAVDAVSDWPIFHPVADETQSDPPEVGALANEGSVDESADADSDEQELISAGNGTWFSAEGPGDCTTNAAIHPYGAHDPNARLAAN